MWELFLRIAFRRPDYQAEAVQDGPAALQVR